MNFQMPRNPNKQPASALQSQSVRIETVTENHLDQRIDNFLHAQLKGVPKSRIYRLLRKGEVRVNKGRVKPEYRLQVGDQVRIPPLRMSDDRDNALPSQSLRKLLASAILYEDDALLVLNKPAGLAVHGGSGFDLGAIEALRAMYPQQSYLELVHRIDRGTSGCLLVAKKRSILRHLQQELREGKTHKRYLALVQGSWNKNRKTVSAPLKRNPPDTGERFVRVSKDGKESITHFEVQQKFTAATLLAVTLETGRTHQIRVHCQFSGHPLAGDEKYGDVAFNQAMRAKGLKRMFLHAWQIEFASPDGQWWQFEAPLPTELQDFLRELD